MKSASSLNRALAAHPHRTPPGVGAPPAARRRRAIAIPIRWWRRRRTKAITIGWRAIAIPHGAATAPPVAEPAWPTALRRQLHMRRPVHGRRRGGHGHSSAAQRYRGAGGNQQGTNSCHLLNSRCVATQRPVSRRKTTRRLASPQAVSGGRPCCGQPLPRPQTRLCIGCDPNISQAGWRNYAAGVRMTDIFTNGRKSSSP